MLENLKKKVLQANLELSGQGLALFTWGNVSERDRRTGLIAIKPSGIEYAAMRADDIVLVDLEGNLIEGYLNPSSDMASHLELYKAFSEIGGVAHTHSVFATAFAQAGRGIPAYGTTHADHFFGDILCTRDLLPQEMENYERNTGRVMVEMLSGNADIMSCSAVLVKNHGVFTWGSDAAEAVKNAAMLENVAQMAKLTLDLNSDAERVKSFIADKHYFRKHGGGAYYGQKGKL